jgi:hypothetical protein
MEECLPIPLPQPLEIRPVWVQFFSISVPFLQLSSAQLTKIRWNLGQETMRANPESSNRTWKAILLLFWQCTENTFFQTFTQICHLLYLILSYLRWLFIKKLNYMYNNNNNITTIVYVEQKNILSYPILLNIELVDQLQYSPPLYTSNPSPNWKPWIYLSFRL